MKNSIINSAVAFTALVISASPAWASTIVFSEDFSGGSAALVASSNPTWADNSGGGFEVYGAGGAGVRGMSGTFDHDQDLSTAQIPIPGAIEVNDDQGNELLTATITLNTSINSGQVGSLTFFGGVRGNNASGASIEIFNLTQAMSLTGISAPTLGVFEWAFNEFNFASTAANIGDILQFRWVGGGSNSANGQEVALVQFSIMDDPAVITVPTPSIVWLFGSGLIGLIATRKMASKASAVPTGRRCSCS